MEDKPSISLRDLASVGKGTPGGEWLRRYWLVVGVAAELQDLPQAVKVLGEDLVLFRDGQGRPGLLGLHCTHRGTSLEYGDVEDAGIRCVYHGWLYDVQGRCLEQPAEPMGSTFHQRVRQPAYPVREQGGLLFAYLGPEAEPPPLPRYAPLQDRGGQRRFEPVRHQSYNWLNFYENGADPAHIWILHRYSAFGEQTWGNQFFSYEDPPDYDLVETDLGMQVVMRKPGATPDTEFVDTFSLALPTILEIADTEFVHLRLDEEAPPRGQNQHWMFLTPNDDDHFMLFTVDYYTGPDPAFFEKLDAKRAEEAAQQEAWKRGRRRSALERGVIRVEDTVAQGTQGTVGERTERLGASDRGVTMLRRLIREAIAAVQEGKRPRGVLTQDRADQVVDLDTFVGVRPRGQLATAGPRGR